MDPRSLTFNADGLIPVIAQDLHSGEVRMMAYANADAVRLTHETKIAHFFSRSRNAIWKKGETSGHTMEVVSVLADCDRDALLYLVLPNGPTCHTGEMSCFFGDASATRPLPTLFNVFHELEARRSSSSEKSYTRALLDAGATKIAEKIREEGSELVVALERESDERVVAEAADVFYHVMVGLLARGRTLTDVAAELARRQGTSGHAEKAARVPK